MGKNIIFLILLAVVFLIVLPIKSYAAGSIPPGIPGPCGDPTVPATFACIPFYLQNVISFLGRAAGIFAIFFIVWAGIKFARSEGDPQRVTDARKTLVYALIGLAVVGLAFVAVYIIQQFTGLQLIA